MGYRFPPDSKLNHSSFIFGVATSSFQIEGATNTDNRCESIWDTFCRKEGAVYAQHNGDIACNHYHLWPEDIDMISGLGVDAYRLSIAWPRIIREDGSTNPAGLAFYDKIINALNDCGIKVFATLYHWDLPQYLEDKGGWLNRETAYKFAEYADVISRHFGNRIYSYTTLNEPWCSAMLGYRLGIHAPGIASDKAGFQACHHLLLAHGLAMPAFRCNAGQASAGIVLNFAPNYPVNGKSSEAADFADDENTHWYLKPVLEGRYPDSVQQHYKESMPLVLDGDMDIISRPVDFVGINYYTRSVVESDPDTSYKGVEIKDAEHTEMGWEVYPQGLTYLLTNLNRRYKLPPIYITENGMAADDRIENGRINDEQRVRYFQTHLTAVDEAIREGVDVRGYFAWSLMDNFEWAEGYAKRFGLVYVDYTTQKRTLKDSAKAYRDFLLARK